MKSRRVKNQTGTLLLSSRFGYADRTVFFGRARLFADRIDLKGWSWTGRHRRVILLHEVEQVRWWSGRDHSANLVLYLEDGGRVSLRVGASGLWKYQIEALLGRQLNVTDDLPEHLSSASAA